MILFVSYYGSSGGGFRCFLFFFRVPTCAGPREEVCGEASLLVGAMPLVRGVGKAQEGTGRAAIALWKKLCGVKGLLEVVREAEILYGAVDTPFQGIAQMNNMTLGSQRPSGQRLLWVFQSILDQKRAGILRQEDISKNKLAESSVITPCDVAAYKYGVLQELMSPEHLNMFSSEFCVEIRKMVESPPKFRAAFEYRDNAAALFDAVPHAALWRSNLKKDEDRLSLKFLALPFSHVPLPISTDVRWVMICALSGCFCGPHPGCHFRSIA